MCVWFLRRGGLAQWGGGEAALWPPKVLCFVLFYLLVQTKSHMSKPNSSRRDGYRLINPCAYPALKTSLWSSSNGSNVAIKHKNLKPNFGADLDYCKQNLERQVRLHTSLMSPSSFKPETKEKER